tara:strand:- start:7044 stop:7547 length:504 start_codon:yes stop_codon:yes gene_type:complete
VLKEYYNNIATYLTETFGANFILLTMLLTTAASVVYFIVISYLITQLDTRYFVRNKMVRKKRPSKKIIVKKISGDKASKTPHLTLMNSSVSLVVNIAKIIVGVFLLVCGVVMLVLPGQGLITIVIGLSLIPFPGKNKIEQKLLSRKSVRSSLNWIRIKANKAPFIFD